MKITKHRFKRWLKEQNPSRYFNYVSNDSCVVASYLKEGLQINKARIRVLPNDLTINLTEYSIPQWLIKLLWEVRFKEHMLGKDGGKIKISTMLKLMNTKGKIYSC